MFRHISRFAITMLFLLSLLTWFYVPSLLAWKLSVLTSQLGHWLALVTILVSVPLFFKPLRYHDFIFAAFAIIALSTFLAPLATSVYAHPGALNVSRLFQMGESPTPFHRSTFLAANDQTPLNIDFYPPTQPATQPKDAAPWVLIVHGGGWNSGTSEQLPELNWYLTKRGYAVISVDYRLSPGWLWPASKEDVMRALSYIRTHAGEWKIDPNRWAILGRSAGAQIAGIVAYSLHGGEKPKGFISYYGPTDLVFGYDLGEEEDILGSRALLRGFLGGTPDQALELYKTASVMSAATADACPTLIIHGEKDTLVSYRHSVRLNETLKGLKADVEFASLSFGPHGFDFFFYGPESQVATKVLDRFLDRVLPLNP